MPKARVPADHQLCCLRATSNLAALALIAHFAFGSLAYGQDSTMRVQHGGPVLFLAQVDAGKVVPRSTSRASATGAFIVDATQRTVTYDLTWQGLEHGNARSIALYNYGAGGNGARIHVLCGDATPCPAGSAGNVTGVWKGDVLDRRILGELASGRMYVEIVGGDGAREIRGQLEPNGAMVPVRSFVAHLVPVSGDSMKSTGTAVLSEVHFPDGRVAVFYEVTVAGTSGRPRGAALIGVAPNADPSVKSLLLNTNSRTLRTLPSRATRPGGTLSAQFEVRRSQSSAVLVTKLLSAGSREVGIVVNTARFPNGELYGVFRPVKH